MHWCVNDADWCICTGLARRKLEMTADGIIFFHARILGKKSSAKQKIYFSLHKIYSTTHYFRASARSNSCIFKRACFRVHCVLVLPRVLRFQRYRCNLQHCEKERMTCAASRLHVASRDRGAHEQHGPLAFTKGSTETFAAFLDEFSDGSWPLSETGEMRYLSSYSDEDHESSSLLINSEKRSECPESYYKVVDAAAATSPSVDATSSSVDAAAAPSPSVATTADASPSPPTANGCDIAKTCVRPSGSCTETCVDSSSFAEKPANDASRALKELFLSAKYLHSSVRKITNPTYLRRMNLSRDDAAGLFPEFESILTSVFMKSMSRREYWPPMKKGACVYIHDAEGRRWPVALECLRTAGQRHVRFNKGWAEMCSANGVSLGKCFRLARWRQESSSSHSAIVTLSIEKSVYNK